MKIYKLLPFIALLSHFAYASTGTAPVSGFARSFIFSSPIEGATITVNETGKTVTTDSEGRFGPIDYPIGKLITLTLSKWGYKTTQSATIIVPKEGLTTRYNNITFQVPSIQTFYILSKLIGATMNDNDCHLTTTVTHYHKTMDDIPQGIPGAQLSFLPKVQARTFYFDIYRSGPLIHKTNPLTKDLTATSEDGGAAIFNLPPRAEPYILYAEKPGVKFTKVMFICKKGAFINISPPQGPSEIISS
jgi:hypothetical protein